MKIEAVIWDLGGVLVRTMDRSRRVDWERKLELETGELDRLVFEGEIGRAAALGKAEAADIWQSLGDRFQLSGQDRRMIEQDFWEGDRIDEALISMTRALRPMIKTGLLSNGWQDLRYALEELWKIADAFDEIVISAELGLAKPDPRIYQFILNRLEVKPQQAVFIDDFITNVEAAKALGLETIHFTGSAEVQAQLRRLLED
jgi:epoxide hydrolase-like predicted phosphatase